MIGRRSEIFRTTPSKTLLTVILAFSLIAAPGTMLYPISVVHAAGGFDYSLSNSGGVTLTPGNSGSTTIIATSTAGIPTNVTLTCDLSVLPSPNFVGSSCSFSPASVTPSNATRSSPGNITRLTVTVPSTANYGSYNITVTSKTGSPAPIAPTIFTLIVAAKVALNPTAVADTSITSGTVPFGLNITDSPPTGFTAFTVSVFFNLTLLHFQGVDYSGNVLGSDVGVSTECLNGVGVPGSGNPCNPDLAVDGPGVFTLSLLRNQGDNTVTPTGTLFTLTFRVVGRGFSAIHVVSQEINTAPDGVPLHTIGYDGYFTNMKCGGVLCKPPTVSITPPLRPLTLRPEIFNSTAASQNPSGFITVYNWTIGLGLNKQHYNFAYNYTADLKHRAPQSDLNVTFDNFGEWSVTLGVEDNYTARAYYTLNIIVLRVWVDLGIASVLIDNTVGILPGTMIHIVATATNNGVKPENSTLRLSINGENKKTQAVVNLANGNESSLTYVWDTSRLAPKVYRVDIDLDEVVNATTGQVIENDASIVQGRLVDPNNARVAYVQLIESLPGGFGVFFGLTLPETIGVGIVIVAVAVFATGLIRKSWPRSPEPL